MRIVTHTCSNTEIVCALGRGDWLIGVDDHSDHPPEVVAQLPKVGPDLDIDIQKIISLQPDLVITSLTVPGHERCLARLEAAGLPLLVTQPHSLADVASDIRRIGDAVDAPAAADRLSGRIDELLDQGPAPGNPVPILVEWWPKPVIVPGRKSWVNEMLALAGGVNPFAGEDVESLEIDTDQVRAAAPEAIVMSWCGVQEEKYRPHVVARRDGWQDIPAIRLGRIIPISEAWLGRPGPRLLDGIEKLRTVVDLCR
ncbi:MAG: cobalamin-binding protein [Wenzhouxiangella sp.]|nr:cobalamin-binding protein [Wenzhouxiangella sp.]TVR95835.1 MAG: cobalamin-binding protein [Wenzhouxiangellaceae bacterium]